MITDDRVALDRRKTLRSAALTFVMVLGMGVSASSVAATATSDADATILAALTLTNTAALSFGAVLPDGTSAGTVVIGADGSRTCNTVACAGQDRGHASGFAVTGEPGFTYSITLPTEITITDGTNTMTVDVFTDSEDGTGTLDGNGDDSFTVGATLNVGANQAANTYTGTFDATVEYN